MPYYYITCKNFEGHLSEIILSHILYAFGTRSLFLDHNQLQGRPSRPVPIQNFNFWNLWIYFGYLV